ncbi:MULTISPECIES: hypothetical protein [Rhizobium]|uniref:hypothetical protein n=1 Tax=Rhizobium TaxID=379 RepID=UPI001B32CF04|nr:MULTISPECIES: hypothetical protein [Rhizobium]MBX4906083.1 hypothetical protein [Rhizobium bangladeshense]MBX5212939.1 hypothetical protein [Rhizobium sp. NLR9a]MBX5220005.1 hypothetical protein [Rhizobium sp. NLR8a]MBX5225585.1 hypothetical protein [Rhizobium sp. NLR9b]MBX5231353.1 hypothetical protein [Rhizobium sp. NLR4a]
MEEEASRFDDPAFSPMVSLEMNIAMFKSQWQFCDEIAEYISDILGQGHSDPARYSNFLSVAANELIEFAFRATDKRGRISFSLYRSATFNRLRITFPYEEEVAHKHTKPRSSGKTQPLDSGSGHLVARSDRTALLNSLTTIFGAAIRIEKDDVDGIEIVADFPSAEDFQ